MNAPLFDDYSKQLQSSIGEIESQLANPEQRALFRQRANISSLQFGENILRHVASERTAYAQTVFNSTVDTEARAASAQWTDKTAVDTSILRVTAAANQRADELGLPKTGTPEELAPRKALLEAAQSKVHSGVLGQMLATGEYVKAAEYFKENRENIDPALAKSVQKAVEDGVQKQQLAVYNRFFTDNMKRLLGELPPECSRRLFELWKQIPERRTGQAGERSPLELLRNMLIRLSEHWSSYRLFDWQKDVPWTNNGTEQVIGRIKMRSRTVPWKKQSELG